MRRLCVVLLFALCSLPLFGQSSQLKSIVVSDMDRKVEPCDDFYEYANGAWRAANPIPASMQRWSRRWKSGEDNKEQLKVILDEAAAGKGYAPGSVEQLIGDFYGACMDEARIDQLGMKPAEPLLREIDAMKARADVEKMIRRLHDIGVNVPFGIYSSPDNHQPTRTIADVYAAGLGLPDRDYYFKPEPRFVEAREKYQAYITQMFKLAGASDAAAADAAKTVFAFETKLAEAHLDNVALRDPQATDHPTTFAQLQKMTPHFDWAAYFKQANIPTADLTVDQPKFMATVDAALANDPVATWKTYLKWQLLNSAAPALAAPFEKANFDFYQAYLGGAQEMKPRWKRCAELADNLLGEALGKKYVEKYFPPEAKARMQELVHNELLAMKDIVEGLDWMSPETKKKALEKIATFMPPGWLIMPG